MNPRELRIFLQIHCLFYFLKNIINPWRVQPTLLESLVLWNRKRLNKDSPIHLTLPVSFKLSGEKLTTSGSSQMDSRWLFFSPFSPFESWGSGNTGEAQHRTQRKKELRLQAQELCQVSKPKHGFADKGPGCAEVNQPKEEHTCRPARRHQQPGTCAPAEAKLIPEERNFSFKMETAALLHTHRVFV